MATDKERLLQLWEAANQVFGDWKPTTYQKKVFESIFVQDKRYVFEEWSRGGGKTVTALKLAFLAALLYPGRGILYVAPTYEDAKKIINDKYNTEFPLHLLAKSSPSTGVFRFKNGSHLTLAGSEGNASQGKGNVGRGLEPVLIIYDEFAYHNPKAHESLLPTLRNDGRLVIISTPPRIDDVEVGRSEHYDKMVELCKQHDWSSYRQVTCDMLVKEGVCTPAFLAMAEADYRSRGEYDEFLAEYWLKRVRRSIRSYFKDIDESLLIPDSHVHKMVDSIARPEYIIAGDSSGNTRWGSLFACLDEDKGILYLIDSLVCKREGANDTEQRIQSGLTPTVYWPRMQYKMNKWQPGEDEKSWRIIWDHETLFIDIIPQLFGSHIHIEQVEKQKDKKNEIFALIRDLITLNRLYISESCRELIEEMRGLAINPKTGDFVKKMDELLDCLRYIVMTYEHYFENRSAPVLPVNKGYMQGLADNFIKARLESQADEYEEILRPEEYW